MRYYTLTASLLAVLLVACEEPMKIQIPELPADEVFSTTCEIMDPVRLKFGEEFFVYPAWYRLSVGYDYVTNPILRRRTTNEELLAGIYDKSGFCKPETVNYIEPDGVTFHKKNYGVIATHTNINFPEGVEFFSLNMGKGIINNPIYRNIELSETAINFAYCDTNNTPERGRCTIYKKVEGTNLYLGVRIAPAGPSTKLNEHGTWYPKDEWSNLMAKLENIIHMHIENSEE